MRIIACSLLKPYLFNDRNVFSSIASIWKQSAIASFWNSTSFNPQLKFTYKTTQIFLTHCLIFPYSYCPFYFDLIYSSIFYTHIKKLLHIAAYAYRIWRPHNFTSIVLQKLPFQIETSVNSSLPIYADCLCSIYLTICYSSQQH